MNWLREKSGGALARYLGRPSKKYETFSATSSDVLQSCLQKGDVLLVEGNLRISVAIKYITQSTWSHAALYVGDELSVPENGENPNTLIEVDLRNGVIAVPLSKYTSLNTRICRPVGLVPDDVEKVVRFAINSIGARYDLKNVFDLMRYLLPTPPVPVRWRRRLLAVGSGDPTRAICSTLIAQAFQLAGYPILPEIKATNVPGKRGGSYIKECLHIRHHSLYTPRDFDVSPYFEIIKPTIVKGFDYKKLEWADEMPKHKPLNPHTGNHSES
jgi:hypothetical protein